MIQDLCVTIYDLFKIDDFKVQSQNTHYYIQNKAEILVSCTFVFELAGINTAICVLKRLTQHTNLIFGLHTPIPT